MFVHIDRQVDARRSRDSALVINVLQHLVEQDLPMVRDLPPRCAPGCDPLLSLVANLVKLLAFDLIVDRAASADDLSQLGRRRCIQQDLVAVVEVIKGEAGTARQRNSQVKDIRSVGFKDRMLRPTEIDEVCEPHEAEIAEVAHENDAQSMQISQVLHADQKVEVDCEDERSESRNRACPQVRRVALRRV